MDAGGPVITMAEPRAAPENAPIFAAPAASPFTTPAPLTIAAEGLSEVHCAVCVMSDMIPSVYTDVAESCRAEPVGTAELAGQTTTESGIGVAVDQADSPYARN